MSSELPDGPPAYFVQLVSMPENDEMVLVVPEENLGNLTAVVAETGHRIEDLTIVETARIPKTAEQWLESIDSLKASDRVDIDAETFRDLLCEVAGFSFRDGWVNGFGAGMDAAADAAEVANASDLVAEKKECCHGRGRHRT